VLGHKGKRIFGLFLHGHLQHTLDELQHAGFVQVLLGRCRGHGPGLGLRVGPGRGRLALGGRHLHLARLAVAEVHGVAPDLAQWLEDDEVRADFLEDVDLQNLILCLSGLREVEALAGLDLGNGRLATRHAGPDGQDRLVRDALGVLERDLHADCAGPSSAPQARPAPRRRLWQRC